MIESDQSVGLFLYEEFSFALVSIGLLGNALSRENQLEFVLLSSSNLFIAGLPSTPETFHFTFSRA